jgi:hypothetical protein
VVVILKEIRQRDQIRRRIGGAKRISAGRRRPLAFPETRMEETAVANRIVRGVRSVIEDKLTIA